MTSTNKKVKRVEVFREDVEYSLPNNPEEFFAFFNTLLERVPTEHKDTADFNFAMEVNECYTDLTLIVSYMREETEEEKAEGIRKKALGDALRNASKLLAYEKLKNELGL